MSKTKATFWLDVHYKVIADPELSNVLTGDAKLVLSFITLEKYGDPNNP